MSLNSFWGHSVLRVLTKAQSPVPTLLRHRPAAPPLSPLTVPSQCVASSLPSPRHLDVTRMERAMTWPWIWCLSRALAASTPLDGSAAGCLLYSRAGACFPVGWFAVWGDYKQNHNKHVHRIFCMNTHFHVSWVKPGTGAAGSYGRVRRTL